MMRFLRFLLLGVLIPMSAFADGGEYGLKNTPASRNMSYVLDTSSKQASVSAKDQIAGQHSCIHINDVGVRVVMSNSAKTYRPNLSDATRAGLVEEAMDIFYKNYDIADAKICTNTIFDMCKIILTESMLASRDTEFIEKCKKIKSALAYTMQFSSSCATGKGNCDKRFAEGVIVQPREGKGLVELLFKTTKPGYSVWCSNNIKERDYQDYLRCKVTDGKDFWNYEYEFDSLDKSIDSAIRSSVAVAGGKILWPGKEPFKDIIIDTGYYDNITARVNGVSGAECSKHNKNINEIFGGYAKTVGNDCETMWHPNYSKFAKRDFDDKGFGTDYSIFKELQIKNVTELDDLFVAYLTHKAEQRGKVVTNIHCDKSPGTFVVEKDIDNYMDGASYKTGVLTRTFADKSKYIRCYGTYEDKELAEDFLFKDTSEAGEKRSNAGITGFKCVTKMGGTFDGKHCSGLSKQQCLAINNTGEVKGGTKWDEKLETCVFNDAADIATFDKVSGTVAKAIGLTVGIVVAVVAAVPSGGTSLMGVIALVGTTVAAEGTVAVEKAQYEAEAEIEQLISVTAKYKTECERGDQAACAACNVWVTAGIGRYGSLLKENQQSAANDMLKSCASLLWSSDPDEETAMAIAAYMQEKGYSPEKLKTLKNVGEKMQFWGGVVAFAAGLLKLGGADKVWGVVKGKNPPPASFSTGIQKVDAKIDKIVEISKKVTDTKLYDRGKFGYEQYSYGKARTDKLITYSQELEKFFGL